MRELSAHVLGIIVTGIITMLTFYFFHLPGLFAGIGLMMAFHIGYRCGAGKWLE